MPFNSRLIIRFNNWFITRLDIRFNISFRHLTWPVFAASQWHFNSGAT